MPQRTQTDHESYLCRELKKERARIWEEMAIVNGLPVNDPYKTRKLSRLDEINAQIKELSGQ